MQGGAFLGLPDFYGDGEREPVTWSATEPQRGQEAAPRVRGGAPPPETGVSQLVTQSSRLTLKSCDDLTVWPLDRVRQRV